MRKKTVLAAVVLAAISGGAQADEMNSADKGFYLSGTGGINLLQDTNISEGAIHLKTQFDDGGYAAGAIGYHVGNLRGEGEIGYRSNDINNIAGVNINAGVHSLSFMGNGYYDFKNSSRFTPYLGAGAGVARLTTDSFSVGGVSIKNASDSEFAYQGIAGFSVGLTDKVKLGLEYRYFATGNPNFDGVKAQCHNNDVGVKLSYNF